MVGFSWGPEQEHAFCTVKRCLNQIQLVGGDPSKQYHLAADASGRGIGAFLFQIDRHPPGTKSSRLTLADEKIVMFMSFALTDPETRYHTTEKEVLAVVRSIEEVR